MADAGPACGLDGVAARAERLPGCADGDQQQLVDVGKCGCGGVDVVEVEDRGTQALIGEGCQALGVAAQGEQISCGDAALQEGVDGECAELSGGADDRDGYETGSFLCQLLMAGARPT